MGRTRLLYIPYGSDKTVLKENGSLVLLVFISHMVQIKLAQGINGTIAYVFNFISHMVQIKRRCQVHYSDFRLLYIPYGSDKTRGDF